MKTLSVSIPMMYADHHVLNVRQILAAVDGVQAVWASAKTGQVTVEAADALTPEQLAQALTAGGYPPDEQPALPVLPDPSVDGSSWYSLIKRITVTNMKDLEMSGDFRRY